MIQDQEFSVSYIHYDGHETNRKCFSWREALTMAINSLLVESDEISIYETRTNTLRFKIGNVKNQVNGKAEGEFFVDLD